MTYPVNCPFGNIVTVISVQMNLAKLLEMETLYILKTSGKPSEGLIFVTLGNSVD